MNLLILFFYRSEMGLFKTGPAPASSDASRGGGDAGFPNAIHCAWGSRCGCGGIGRRAGFRCLFPYGSGGSTPLIRIIFPDKSDFVLARNSPP